MQSPTPPRRRDLAAKASQPIITLALARMVKSPHGNTINQNPGFPEQLKNNLWTYGSSAITESNGSASAREKTRLFCQQRSSCLNDPLTGGSILFYIIQSKKVGSNPTFCYAIKDYANYESSSHSFIYAAIGDIISNDLISSASNSILLS